MFDYIIYYSKNKINMLFEQLDDGISETLQGKIGVNLGVISGEVSTSEQSQSNNMGKLEIVLKHLQAENLVGGIREDKGYI